MYWYVTRAVSIVIFIRWVKTLSTFIQTQVTDIHRHKITDNRYTITGTYSNKNTDADKNLSRHKHVHSFTHSQSHDRRWKWCPAPCAMIRLSVGLSWRETSDKASPNSPQHYSTLAMAFLLSSQSNGWPGPSLVPQPTCCWKWLFPSQIWTLFAISNHAQCILHNDKGPSIYYH